MTPATVLDPPAPGVIAFFKVLADETRLTIIRLLTLTDLRAGELVEMLGLPQNAVSYHLKHLRAAGLLRDHRSQADARDIYYSLAWEKLEALYAAAGAALRLGNTPPRPPRPTERPVRVLFLCTHNSARSQLAEGLLRYLGGAAVAVASAGSSPAAAVHPDAVALLAAWGIDPAPHRPKPLSAVVDQPFDVLITVCDRVREQCPTFAHGPRPIHWSIPDPATLADDTARQAAFAAVGQELQTRIRYLLGQLQPGPGAPVMGSAGAGAGR
ncbi:MAG TPA: metalloregulator ArsR/SmtB family transcription factor [Chloroflexia bacterium]|nr:metalloregulator ArsR/SmtB family transcription factor [Chloroflexia bacterium]